MGKIKFLKLAFCSSMPGALAIDCYLPKSLFHQIGATLGFIKAEVVDFTPVAEITHSNFVNLKRN